MAITRAQQYRQMLENGGRGISLQEAKDMAPKGEFLAYINKKEAKMLKDAGGSGIMTNAGIPSFIEYDGGDSGTFSQAASTGSVQGDVDRGGGDDDRGRDPTKQFEGDKPISKEAEKALKAQRKKARYQITPSTRPSNRIISTLLSQVVPFGGMLYNRAIDQRAMGFGPTKITKKPTDIIFNDDDDDNQNMITQTPYQEDTTEDDVLSPIQQAILERDRLGGPRAFAKEGGIMDLETGRQMYFLGKLVKKATRAVKKIAKSPIGKAALLYGGYKLGKMPIGDGGSLFDRGFDFYSNMETADKVKLGIGGALTLAPLLFQDDDSDEEYKQFASQSGPGLPAAIPDIRKNYRDYMARAFVADGGTPEPVAKKTMPLLDMDGKEMDLRAEGGFVPIGRMEKADDVPARLSKNEFVFTADAVRNAGDGDVDKGAEVMYNMMKNLESGGDVSEESQGLEGARRMFQTSQRLEEVI